MEGSVNIEGQDVQDVRRSKRTTKVTRSSTRKLTSKPVANSDVCDSTNSNVVEDSEVVTSETTVDTHNIVGASEVTEGKVNRKRPLYHTMKHKRGPVRILPRANNSDSYEASWSELDKQRLLIALQRFGTMEIENILKSVPGKSEEDIKKYIKLKWKLARVELRTHLKEVRKGVNSRYLGPIDKWLEVLNKTFPNFDHYKSNPLAHAVLLIWKYEKHPDPAECGGVDFKAMYEYLYCMLCGYPPKHLNQPTATYLTGSLKNFAYGIKNLNWSEITKFLESPQTIQNSLKNSTVKEEDVVAALSYTKKQCLDELLKVPGFNPFCVPQDLLKRKAPIPFEEPIKSSASVPVQESTQTTASATNQSALKTTAPTSCQSSSMTTDPTSHQQSSQVTIVVIPESSVNTTLMHIPEQMQVTAPTRTQELPKAASASIQVPTGTTNSEPILELLRTTKPLRTYSRASKKTSSATTDTRT